MSSSGHLKVSRRSRHLSSPPPPPLSPLGLNTTTTISSRQTNLSRIKQSSDSRLRSLTNRQRLCISLGELVLEIAERGLKTSDLESALLEVVTAATSTNDMLITPSTSSFSSNTSSFDESSSKLHLSSNDNQNYVIVERPTSKIMNLFEEKLEDEILTLKAFISGLCEDISSTIIEIQSKNFEYEKCI